MRRRRRSSIRRALLGGLQRIATIALAVGMTLCVFLVLPVIQALADGQDDVVQLTEFDPGYVPPPPPPPEPEPEPEEQEEEEPPPPDFEDAPPPPDLDAMSQALSGGFGASGYGSIDLGARLDALAAGDGGAALFSLDDLDTPPRVTHQPLPVLNDKQRKRTPGQVVVIFIVNERGRVESATVQSSSDPIFEKPALDAVKKWKFEPGQRGGESVSTRMRQPITLK